MRTGMRALLCVLFTYLFWTNNSGTMFPPPNSDLSLRSTATFVAGRYGATVFHDFFAVVYERCQMFQGEIADLQVELPVALCRSRWRRFWKLLSRGRLILDQFVFSHSIFGMIHETCTSWIPRRQLNRRELVEDDARDVDEELSETLMYSAIGALFPETLLLLMSSNLHTDVFPLNWFVAMGFSLLHNMDYFVSSCIMDTFLQSRMQRIGQSAQAAILQRLQPIWRIDVTSNAGASVMNLAFSVTSFLTLHILTKAVVVLRYSVMCALFQLLLYAAAMTLLWYFGWDLIDFSWQWITYRCILPTPMPHMTNEPPRIAPEQNNNHCHSNPQLPITPQDEPGTTIAADEPWTTIAAVEPQLTTPVSEVASKVKLCMDYNDDRLYESSRAWSDSPLGVMVTMAVSGLLLLLFM